MRVARPSANVSIRSSTRRRSCQERNAAGAASDWTAITLTLGLTAPATMQAPAAPLPPPAGTMITSVCGCSSRISSVCGGDAGDQQRLVAGVHVAVAVLEREPLAVLARVVEIAAVEDELGAEAAHRGDLDRVRLLRDADRRPHAEEAGGVGDRLAVVAGRGGDHAALPLVCAELRDQVDPAAHLEGADRLVVLVLDEDVGAEQLVSAG